MKNSASLLFLLLLVAPIDAAMLKWQQGRPKQRALQSHYRSDCWKRRPVASLLTKTPDPHDPGYPGAGLREFVPYETVLKDGFINADCVKDELFVHGDKFGDGRHSYTLGDVANVSVVHYAAKVPKEDRQPMTQQVCFRFCRTVPNMQIFGILNGRECYCAPHYNRLASDDSPCDATCEGDSTSVCGSKTKSSIFVMHLCGDTQAQLDESRKLVRFVVSDLENRIQLATRLANICQEEGGRQQGIFSKAGNPGVANDLMQEAKNLEIGLVRASALAKKAVAQLKTLSAESEKLHFGKADEIDEAEQLLDQMAGAVQFGKMARKILGDVIVLATPSKEELGAAGTYYPMMYFIDKQFSDSMQTCSGDTINTPIVGDTMDGCASACDAERGAKACVGFSYFSTGNTSLCFLLASLDKAVVYTKCKKESSNFQTETKIERRSSSSPSKVKPVECGQVGTPFQVVNHEHGATEVLKLNIKTGKYEPLFQLDIALHKKWGIKDVNSCAINPVDSRIYCTMGLKNVRKCALARVDDKLVSFVGRVKCGFISGTFDAHGNFYFNDKGELLTARKVQDLPETGTPFGLGKLATDNFKVKLGFDIASVEADLDGKGMATYVVGLMGSDVTMVRVSSDPYKTFNLKVTGETAEGAFGAAWNFKNQLYFASNAGKGVYQLVLDSIDLKASTAKMARAASAMETNNNDGMGCSKGVSPFPPVLPPKPEPVEWMHDEMHEPEHDLQEHEPEKKHSVAPPKGEVYCMVKFSKFAGTTLKPDPSGKCRHCFKKFTRSDCY